jgi:hypothetical protein
MLHNINYEKVLLIFINDLIYLKKELPNYYQIIIENSNKFIGIFIEYLNGSIASLSPNTIELNYEQVDAIIKKLSCFPTINQFMKLEGKSQRTYKTNNDLTKEKNKVKIEIIKNQLIVIIDKAINSKQPIQYEKNIYKDTVFGNISSNLIFSKVDFNLDYLKKIDSNLNKAGFNEENTKLIIKKFESLTNIIISKLIPIQFIEHSFTLPINLIDKKIIIEPNKIQDGNSINIYIDKYPLIKNKLNEILSTNKKIDESIYEELSLIWEKHYNIKIDVKKLKRTIPNYISVKLKKENFDLKRNSSSLYFSPDKNQNIFVKKIKENNFNNN